MDLAVSKLYTGRVIATESLGNHTREVTCFSIQSREHRVLQHDATTQKPLRSLDDDRASRYASFPCKAVAERLVQTLSLGPDRETHYVIASQQFPDHLLVILSVKTAPQRFSLPSRRAVAGVALVSVLSAIENQRKSKQKPEQEAFAAQDMSGELQTIPARHGVATFVPRGRTIKIINTYGKQVVSTWAFSLNAPPQKGDDEEEVDEEEVKEVEKQVDDLQKDLKEGEGKGEADKVQKEVEKPKEEAEKGKQNEDTESKTANSKETEDTSQEAEDPSEQAPDTPDNEKTTTEKKPQKRTWSSYIPSMPYRSKNQNQNASPKAETKTEKEQNTANSRAWSSYLPTGKGFSSYVPNVQLPDKEGVISAFQASHYRDPNKSYAEQLYDFSKTPVGAGSLAAATGSGTASSIYAAYSAYAKSNPSKSDQPPMEYLSLPHTRAATYRLVPSVDDTLLTNLRNPLMTLIEDTSPGAHDTLTAACDASLYAALNVDKPEEHGSCAENLVLALKELNEKAGLKGTKAVGADITVNIAPTPLHLFMNAPLDLDSNAQSEGSGAKGSRIKVEEPTGKKRSYVRFRAERDMVVVLSACPNEIGPQNGGRCMAANFMVEEDQDDLSASTPSLKSKKGTPKKLGTQSKQSEEKPAPKKGMPNLKGGPQKPAAVKKSAERKNSGADDPPESELPADKQPKQGKKEEAKQEETPKPKKKPKKLERRTASSATTTKSEQ